MNNQELELKLKELLNIKNYCEYAAAVKNFIPEYKKSDLYRTTKMPLKKALSEARIHYLLNTDNLIQKTQTFINNLNFDNVQDIISQFADMYAQENRDIAQGVELLNEIMNGNNSRQ